MRNTDEVDVREGAMKGLGHIPDPPHIRAVAPRFAAHPAASANVSTLPSSSGLLPFAQIIDQGSTSACTGCAIAQAVHVRRAKMGMPQAFPSPLALYLSGRIGSGAALTDDGGAFPRSVWDGAVRMGWAEIAAWPFAPTPDGSADSNVLRMPPWSVWRDGGGHIGLTAHVVDSTGDALHDDIVRALGSGYPFTFALQIDTSMEQLGPGDVWNGPTGQMLGGHYLCGLDWDAIGVFAAQSWGTSGPGTGDRGIIRIGWDAIIGATDIDVLELAP